MGVLAAEILPWNDHSNQSRHVLGCKARINHCHNKQKQSEIFHVYEFNDQGKASMSPRYGFHSVHMWHCLVSHQEKAACKRVCVLEAFA
jgi:hypothetical protein